MAVKIIEVWRGSPAEVKLTDETRFSMRQSDLGTLWLDVSYDDQCIAVVPAGGKLILEAI
jgi:hypothetical protein